MALSWQDADRVYARLVEAVDSLDEAAGEAFLARLVLLLASDVDDVERVLAAIGSAAAGRGPTASGGPVR